MTLNPGKGNASRLLASKLRPPHLRVDLLSRSHLQTKLQEGLERKITVLNAPAGFGKTSLLLQWHELLKEGMPVAWLSFDRYDTDISQVMAYIVQALGGVAPQLSDVLVQPSGHPGDAFVGTVLAKIHAEVSQFGECALFLDDYHMVQNEDVHAFMMQFIRSAPENLHVFLATRSRSALPTSGMALHGQVAEVQADDLRLSADEVAEMFAKLQPDALQMLLARTEGWPMAVQLARHWSSGALVAPVIENFSGSSGEIATYLTEQIMEELPQHVQQLLIMASITDETNGDLANALCDRSDAWEVLTSLDQLGALLVPVDRDQRWFRFHDLFSDYLRTRLKRLGEEQVRALHRKASRWFGERNQLEGAMRHSALAGDHEITAEWLERAGGVSVGVHDGGPYLRQLLAYIPGPVITIRPRLRAARAIVLMKEGMAVEAASEISETMRLIDAGQDDRAARQDALIVRTTISAQGDDGLSLDIVASLEVMIGDAAVARPWMQGALNDLLTLTHIRRGNYILARAACREARYLYDEDGIQNGRVFSRLHMGSIALGQGRLKEAREELERATEMSSAYLVADASTLAMIHVMLATALYEENQLVQAEKLCFSALEDSARGEGWLEIYHSGYMTASGLHLARGDFDAALAQLDEGYEVAERRMLPRLRSMLAYRRMEVITLRNAMDVNLDNKALHGELQRALELSMSLEREVAIIALSRIAVQRGMAGEADNILRGLQHEVEELGRGKVLIKILILRAFAARAADRMDDAASALRRALALAAPEGWRRQFLEEGPAIIELLNAALRHIQIASLPSASVSFLAEIFSAQIDPEGRHSSDPSHILTPREREVLAGLRKQQSNKVIAREFGVTDNAVKYHLKNIYAKLGVNDREMAVAVALQHGLLPNEPQPTQQ